MIPRTSEFGPMRVVETDLAHPAYTTACDEAMMIARSQDLVPDTLHLYRRSRPTISLGYFQRAEDCVDLDRADERGVGLVRRLSGGSAIYTDPGQVIYCVVVSADRLPDPPMESYPLVCQGVVEALKLFGLVSEWMPLNDILVNGKKISGSAQTRKRGVVVQHGTLLVDTDLDLMLALLVPQPGKRVRERKDLTTLKEELGISPDMALVRAALIKGFGKALGRPMVHGSLVDEEHSLIRELSRSNTCRPARGMCSI